MAGRVVNREDLDLPQRDYDFMVLGAGVLGLACAFYLKQLMPDKTVLVIEEEGIPSEQGATHVSPSVFLPRYQDLSTQKKLSWTRQVLANLSEETGVYRPHDSPFRSCGLLHFLEAVAEGLGSSPVDKLQSYLPAEHVKVLSQMLELNQFSSFSYDEQGGYGSAEAVALHYGYGAVKQGVDLLLNTRVKPLSDIALSVERLSYNREMQRVVVKQEKLSAHTVVVAMGAQTATFVEEALGQLLPYKKAYRQYPRLEANGRLPLEEGRVSLPVVQAKGFFLRPQGDGLLIVPPPLGADPKGYQAQEGHLMGVKVGVRREILEQLLDASEALKVLTWESLNLGKTLSKVRGSWDVLSETGLPESRQLVGTHWYSLVGGEKAFSLGLATAYDLAATLAKQTLRPWD